MKKNIFITLCILVGSNIFSQDLSLDYYEYLYNPYNVNPAYAAEDNKLALNLNHRQRTGINSSNTMLGGHGLIGGKQGIGGRFMADNRNAFQTLKVDATYAYSVKINDKQKLALGLSVGVINRSINTSRINNYDKLDASDLVLQPTYLKSNTFTAGAGFVYNYSNFELAVASPHITQGIQKIGENIYVLTSYKIKIKEKLIVTPSLFYFNIPVVKNLAGVQVKAEYSSKLWLQCGYQSNADLNIAVGYKLGPVGIGYGYSVYNGLLKAQSNGIHEVIFTMQIANAKKVE
jgi:type IX secretion system PorP/SprF family membrane protein